MSIDVLNSVNSLEFEIIDHNDEHKMTDSKIGMIDCVARFQIDNEYYALVYQACSTQDVGAVSLVLSLNDEVSDDKKELEKKLKNKYGENNGTVKFEELNQELRSKAQEEWDKYLSENYQEPERSNNFMDANSVCNEIKPKQ